VAGGVSGIGFSSAETLILFLHLGQLKETVLPLGIFPSGILIIFWQL
jgi:hypothetical protein